MTKCPGDTSEIDTKSCFSGEDHYSQLFDEVALSLKRLLNHHKQTPELMSILEKIADQMATALAQREAAATLEAGEERYRRVFEVESDTIFLVDTETQRLIDVNGAALELYGYSREEFLRMKAGDVSAEPGKTWQAITGGQMKVRLRWHRKKDGTIFPVEIAGNYFECRGRKIHVAAIRDMSERMLRERLLLQANEQLELAKKAAAAGIWDWDIESGRVEWSPEMYGMLGLDPRTTEASGDAFRSVIHPEDAAAVWESIDRDLRERNSHHTEFRIVKADGQVRWIGGMGCITYDNGHEPVRMTGICMDITDRKCAIEALQCSEERFRQMFEHMGSGMVVYEVEGDGSDFIIKEFNPAAEKAGNTSRAEVIGRRVSRAFPGLKEIGLFQSFQRVWRTGIPEHHPASFYRDDRFSVWVENYVFKLPSGEVVAIIDDITNRKRAEAELRKSEIWHRSLIELGVSVYVVLDEKRRILYASPLVEQVLGWKPAEIAAQSIFEFVSAEDAESAARFFTEILHAPRRKSGSAPAFAAKTATSWRWSFRASICSTNRPCAESS